MVRRLTAADIVSVVFPAADPQQLAVQVARGPGSGGLLGHTYPVAGSMAGAALAAGHGLIVDSGDGRFIVHLQLALDVGSVMACPLMRHVGPQGAVVVGRRRAAPSFTEADLRMAEAFANHAAVALELADRRENQRRLEVLEDRARIARDLHDHTIQRIFAAGLTVQAEALRTRDPTVAASLTSVVDSLDDAIRQIRSTIFDLQDSGVDSASPHAALMRVAAEVEPALGFAPDLAFTGPVDTVIGSRALEDAEAVLREGLTNIAKHSDADHVAVAIQVSARHMVIQIADNGSKALRGSRRSGLANLRRRAELRGGALLVSHDAHGTTLRWSAALDG